MTTLVAEQPMAKETKADRKNTPVRIGDEAIRWARIASGYTGESMADYITRIVEERAQHDVDRLHQEVRPAKVAKSRGAAK